MSHNTILIIFFFTVIPKLWQILKIVSYRLLHNFYSNQFLTRQHYTKLFKNTKTQILIKLLTPVLLFELKIESGNKIIHNLKRQRWCENNSGIPTHSKVMTRHVNLHRIVKRHSCFNFYHIHPINTTINLQYTKNTLINTNYFLRR